MDLVIDWCGFLGAWLLVAGPMNQAALELQEEGEVGHDRIEAAARAVAREPRVSPWWWLLPPVGYAKSRARSQRERRRMMAALDPAETRALVTYLDKSTGWFLVAAGAALIAAKETWELAERMEWGVAVFVALWVAMLVACGAYTVARVRRNHSVVAEAERRAERRAG